MRLAPQELRTYFVTAVSAGRRRVFQTTANASLMLDVIRANREKKRMEIHAFVLMPDHMHLVLTPAPEVSLEKAMQFLKGGYSFLLKSRLGVWERGYRERRIVDVEDFATARHYVEQNPVRAQMAEKAEEYVYSSAGKHTSLIPHLPGSQGAVSGAEAPFGGRLCSGA